MKDRDTSKDYAELTKNIPIEIRKKYFTLKFDNCLKIVLYCEPFRDSRPRINKFGGVGMVNMGKMKKVFNILYEKYPLLQEIIVQSPYLVVLDMFSLPTKKEMSFIKKDKETLKLFNKEALYDLAIADVDNSIKIHNDILFEPEYRVTLDDAMNIGVIGNKYLSTTPRAELYVYFSSKTSKFYKWRIHNNHNYFKWLISEKNMLMNKRDINEQRKYLIKLLREYIADINKEKDAKDFVKRVAKELIRYPADTIKELAKVESKNFNKNNALLSFMLEVCKNNKYCLEKLNNLTLLFEEENCNEEPEPTDIMGIYSQFLENK